MPYLMTSDITAGFQNLLTETRSALGEFGGKRVIHLAYECQNCSDLFSELYTNDLTIEYLTTDTDPRAVEGLVRCKAKRDKLIADLKGSECYSLSGRGGITRTRHKGVFEGTLTYSPKWMSDEQAQKDMRTAIVKLMKYYKTKIKKFRAVGEGGDGVKNSHVHFMYELENGGKITDKCFKRAWKWWDPKKPYGKGFQGGHHQGVKDIANFSSYMEKDIETAWLDLQTSDDPIDIPDALSSAEVNNPSPSVCEDGSNSEACEEEHGEGSSQSSDGSGGAEYR